MTLLSLLILRAYARGWRRICLDGEPIGWERGEGIASLRIISCRPGFNDPPGPHPTGGRWWGYSVDPDGCYLPAVDEAQALAGALLTPRHRRMLARKPDPS